MCITTMTDPNTVYKSGYANLTRELGRLPKITDQGWLDLHAQYSKSWGPAEETIHAAKSRVTSPVNELALQAHAMHVARECSQMPTGEEATGTPGITATVPEPGYSLPGRNGPARQTEGARGTGGGLMAVCVACGRTWEREKRRGRPGYLCRECR